MALIPCIRNRFIACLCWLFIAFLPVPGLAQIYSITPQKAVDANGLDAQGQPSFGTLRLMQAKVRVTDIIDGVTLRLEDKTIVRLSGLWVPWETGDDPGDTVAKAADFLRREYLGRFVRVYQTKKEGAGRTNRLGQNLAHVVRDDGQWVQGAMLSDGLAMVMTTESTPEMAKPMTQLEAKARAAKKGLWENARWEVITPPEAAAFLNEFKIIEGLVLSSTVRDNKIYLNFGQDWKTDFTIVVPTGKRQAFARAGADIMGLNGKKIRVRGWVQDVNGPSIELTHPAQIEVLP